MAAKSILYRVVAVPTPVVKSPLVKMAAVWEPESREQIP